MPASASTSFSTLTSPAKGRRATTPNLGPAEDAAIGSASAQSLIKSKERVRDLAEVYTAEREVNAMLDLVKDEAKRIDSRFLEPACGNGNFLSAIIKRKLETVARRKASQDEFEFNTLVALSSTYGIDICPENVEESRQRLLLIVKEHYYGEKRNTWKAPEHYFDIASKILGKNIVVGDSINGADKILLSEWSFPAAGKVKEKVFRFSELTQDRPKPIKELPLRKWKDILNE